MTHCSHNNLYHESTLLSVKRHIYRKHTFYDLIMRCELVSLLYFTLFPRYQSSDVPAVGLQQCRFYCRWGLKCLFVSPPSLFRNEQTKVLKFLSLTGFFHIRANKQTLVKSKLSLAFTFFLYLPIKRGLCRNILSQL